MLLNNHAQSRRPAYWVALALAIIAMLLSACGDRSQPEPAAPVATAESPAAAPQGAADSQPTPDSAATAGPVTINLPIANRSTILTREDLRVYQGDTVKLSITSDEEGEIHLHGYDLTAQVSPDHPGELTFDATNAGAFGINFHVFASDPAAHESDGHGHDHDGTAAKTVVSDSLVSVAITAEPDASGGVDVNIATEGFRFAPDLVDQPHEPGVGHAHIYVDGEKISRVFESTYHIAALPPGEHEIRVSLNTNDHSELEFEGARVESIVSVTVPDVGQATGDDSHAGHDHGAEHEIVAEVHLGNLEVYP